MLGAALFRLGTSGVDLKAVHKKGPAVASGPVQEGNPKQVIARLIWSAVNRLAHLHLRIPARAIMLLFLTEAALAP